MDETIKQAIGAMMGDRVRFGEPLAGLTTFGLGGRAAVLAEPDTVTELLSLMKLIRDRAVPYFVLGGGSNVLFRDGGFDGVVVRLGAGFAGIDLTASDGREAVIEAGAAAPTPFLLAKARKEGLTGLEFLAGIPGRVGGALAMNAGTRDGSILDATEFVDVLDEVGTVSRLGRPELRAGYRRLDLPEGTVILKGTFRLRVDAPEMVEARIRDILARRSASQPRGVRSAGSVFKNPPGEFAGRLIDRAGLKGRRVGRAWVAAEHANFIVHQGDASAADVIALMDEISRVVRERFGVDLEREVIIAGQNGDIG